MEEKRNGYKNKSKNTKKKACKGTYGNDKKANPMRKLSDEMKTKKCGHTEGRCGCEKAMEKISNDCDERKKSSLRDAGSHGKVGKFSEIQKQAPSSYGKINEKPNVACTVICGEDMTNEDILGLFEEIFGPDLEDSLEELCPAEEPSEDFEKDEENEEDNEAFQEDIVDRFVTEDETLEMYIEKKIHQIRTLWGLYTKTYGKNVVLDRVLSECVDLGMAVRKTRITPNVDDQIDLLVQAFLSVDTMAYCVGMENGQYYSTPTVFEELLKIFADLKETLYAVLSYVVDDEDECIV